MKYGNPYGAVECLHRGLESVSPQFDQSGGLKHQEALKCAQDMRDWKEAHR